jgi:hypothetical protein
MHKGQAMLKVVEEIYEGGRDVIEGKWWMFWRRKRKWVLFDHAQSALRDGGVEALWRYYDGLVRSPNQRGRWVKLELERHSRKTVESEYDRFKAIYQTVGETK